MKPGKPLKRSELKPGDKPLVRRAELRNKTELRSTSRVADLSRVKPLKTKHRVADLDELHARATVRGRSGGICECCGRERATDYAHRVGTGVGGGWSAANALDSCRACHQFAHAHPRKARELGWLLLSTDDPDTTPAQLAGRGLVLLTADGGVTPLREGRHRMSVQKFRMKPVVIEAVQFSGDNHSEIAAWTSGHFQAVDPEDRNDDPEITAAVWDKLHSTWVGVKDGQWVIRGVQGEHYPCAADIFAATYEPVSA